MINVFLTGLLATLALAQQTDTTVQVQAGARLRLDNPGGLVTIRTWEQNAMRVRADHSQRATIEIRNSGAVVIIEAVSERGPGSIVDYELTIPSSMHLELDGDYSDFDVQGVGGQVSVQTMEGDISVSGGSERIRLESVHGSIELSDHYAVCAHCLKFSLGHRGRFNRNKYVAQF